MSEETNKAVVRRFYAEVVSGGHSELLAELAHPDVVDHAALPWGLPAGIDGFSKHIRAVNKDVADATATVNDLIAEADRVVAYWTFAGKLVRDMFGVVARGQHVAIDAISTLTLRDGKIIDYRVLPDSKRFLDEQAAATL